MVAHSISGFRLVIHSLQHQKRVRMREDVQHDAWGVSECSYSPVLSCLVLRLPYMSALLLELREHFSQPATEVDPQSPNMNCVAVADPSVTCMCTLSWHQDSITHSLSSWSDRLGHQFVVRRWITKSCSKSSGVGVKPWTIQSICLVANCILSILSIIVREDQRFSRECKWSGKCCQEELPLYRKMLFR